MATTIEKIKNIWRDIFQSLPAGIPYAGDIYAQYLSKADSRQVRALIRELKEATNEQQNILERELNLSRKDMSEITSLMERVAMYSEAARRIVVVVPTGGLGKSMFPITNVIPKCLIPIGKLSMLQHILNSLKSRKDIFRNVIVLTRAFSDAIEENVAQGQYGDFVECSHIEKHVPDALLDIRDQISGGPFLLYYTDILIEDIQWKHVYDRHFDLQKQYNTIGTLLCSKYYPLEIGIINERRPELMSSFEEKPINLPDGFANLGVSIFEPDFFNYIEPNDTGVFEQSIDRALKAKRSFGLYKVGTWYHVDSIGDYHRVLQSPFGHSRPAT